MSEGHTKRFKGRTGFKYHQRDIYLIFILIWAILSFILMRAVFGDYLESSYFWGIYIVINVFTVLPVVFIILVSKGDVKSEGRVFGRHHYRFTIPSEWSIEDLATKLIGRLEKEGFVFGPMEMDDVPSDWTPEVLEIHHAARVVPGDRELFILDYLDQIALASAGSAGVLLPVVRYVMVRPINEPFNIDDDPFVDCVARALSRYKEDLV